jgi:hypothetical protein
MGGRRVRGEIYAPAFRSPSKLMTFHRATIAGKPSADEPSGLIVLASRNGPAMCRASVSMGLSRPPGNDTKNL